MSSELEPAEHGGRYGEQGEQQMAVVAELADPDEQMNDRERQARRGHHAPDDDDPAHGVPKSGGPVPVRYAT